jgi:hypothetical protein
MEWEGIEVILEVTGAVEFGARVALEAFAHKKHVIAMNAELDGTLGPLLKVRGAAGFNLRFRVVGVRHRNRHGLRAALDAPSACSHDTK